jgi:cytidylate kinase
MKKKHIITIAGKPGSGKSTASKGVAKTLGFQHFSSGDFFRAIGQERGIDVFQANLVAEKEAEIDYLVDEKLRTLGAQEDNLVIDSRMAWHWMPYSFRVYLDLDLMVAAERIITSLDDVRMEVEDIPGSPAEYAARLQDRLDSEIRRYDTLYQVNPYDPSNYDLVIDTAVNGPAAVQALVLENFQTWLTQAS